MSRDDFNVPPQLGADTGLPPARCAGHSRSGVVLIVVMSLLGALLVFGGIVVSILSVDLRNLGYYKRHTTALHQADAGARYVLARVREDVAAGTLKLDSANEPISYAVPVGFDFDPVTNLVRLADRRSYLYVVTGRSGNSRSRLEVIIRADSGLPVSVFGEYRVLMKPGTAVDGYDSHLVSGLPTGSTATERAAVGVNGILDSPANLIDGTIYLGAASNGTPATYTSEASEMLADVVHGDRLNPDPLGLFGGSQGARMAAAALSNDNARAVGGSRAGNVLTITGDVTLPTGVYYVDRIDLANHRTLTIDASAGPVTVYLTGTISTAPQASVSVTPAAPGSLRIFATTSSTLDMEPKTDFVGSIYAPHATIHMQPGGNAYGAYWGYDVTLWPGNSFFADIALLSELDLALPRIVSWKESL